MTYTLGFWVKHYLGAGPSGFEASNKSIAKLEFFNDPENGESFYIISGLLYHGEVKRVYLDSVHSAIVILEQNDYNPCIN